MSKRKREDLSLRLLVVEAKASGRTNSKRAFVYSKRFIEHFDEMIANLPEPIPPPFPNQLISVPQNQEYWRLFRQWVTHKNNFFNCSDMANLLAGTRHAKEIFTANREGIPRSFKGNEFTELGHRIEELAIEWFVGEHSPIIDRTWRNVTRKSFNRITHAFRPGPMVARTNHGNYIQASADLIVQVDEVHAIYDNITTSRLAIVEMKSWFKDRQTPVDFIDIPAEYVFQVLIQMFVWEIPLAYLVFFNHEELQSPEQAYGTSVFRIESGNLELLGSIFRLDHHIADMVRLINGQSKYRKPYFSSQDLRKLFLPSFKLVHPRLIANSQLYSL